MKDRKSKLLAAVVTELEKPRRQTKADKALFARLAEYPFGFREAVYCWLWANHAEVEHLRTNHGVSWQGIANLAREDGVAGQHGQPPNANSVRRVWGRVCRNKEKKAEREAKYEQEQQRLQALEGQTWRR